MLDVGSLISVNVQIAPNAISVRDFGTLLIIGKSSVIPVAERIRFYNTLSQMAEDFTDPTAPEYQAATLYFSQSPAPAKVAIGRWNTNPTPAQLICGKLSSAYQTVQAWKDLAPFDFKITVNGTAVEVSVAANELTSVTTMAELATVLQGKVTGTTVTYDADHFVFTTTTTGVAATISYIESASTVVNDVSQTIAGTSATGAQVIAGKASETPVDTVNALIDKSQDWYACMFADNTVSNVEYTTIAAIVEATVPERQLAITSQDTADKDPNDESGIGATLNKLKYKKTVVQYSSTMPYAVASYMARMFITNFYGTNTMQTMMYKSEPGVQAEDLSTTEASTLKARGINVYAMYNNGASIIQHGTQIDGSWSDEVYGLDWLKAYIQTTMFNAFYTTTNKVPGTETGMNVLLTALTTALEQAYTNGLLAERPWTGDVIGALRPGNILMHGYYIYYLPVSTQTAIERTNRTPPVMQVAIGLSGAFHSATVIINVMR